MLRPRARYAFALAAAAALCFAAPFLAGAADDDGFTAIFNGKDLTGWEGDPTLWTVEDGAITGTTTDDKKLPYNKFLIYRAAAPKNFDLKAKVKMVGNSNSGIQYRSKQLKEVGEFVVAGYQMDIHPSPNYNGMLYDERGRSILAESGQTSVAGEDGKVAKKAMAEKPAPVKLDEWNEYEVIARGETLTHKINGKTVCEVVDRDPKNRDAEGIIAFQVHVGPAMRVQFKDVLLKTLPDEPERKAPPKKAVSRSAPSGPAPKSTPVDRLKVAKGFKVELVHEVSRDGEGSWVSMAFDPKNRMIVSDQYGKLFRVTPSPVGGPASSTKVEPINVDIGEAQGLLWAFDSLYVMVNRGNQYESGLYRVRDTDGDDQLDKVEQLRKIEGGGEHGPHAIALAPDGKSLYVVAGNATRLPEVSASVVPKVWGEDYLIPRMPDGAGFMRDEKAPGGWVCKVDPDGKNFELVSAGFRNPYDIAFSSTGELFTYDSDMEWDVNLPWYRPTRVCHVTSGSEFGYRNGSGKWPTYYLDSLPPVVNIGPGSPTGIAFGYGAKFPAKYRDALFISDWSYGKLYAVHLKPEGSTFGGDVEEFVAGSPLPLTDLAVNPADGALYFAVGGRRTTSALYRVVADGFAEAGAPASLAGSDLRDLRHRLESFHGKKDPSAVETVWPYLGHADRFIRFAARVALEFQDPLTWRERALAEADPARALPALLALARVSATDPANRTAADPDPDPVVKAKILAALEQFVPARLGVPATIDLLRVYEVVFTRFGKPDAETDSKLISKLDPLYPSRIREVNAELAKLLVYLSAPDAAAKTVALMEVAPTQEEQISYAEDLRALETGWSPDLRKRFFTWLSRAAGYKGGNSFRGFMKNIRDDTLAKLSDEQKAELKPILEAPTPRETVAAVPPRAHVKDWTMDELVPLVDDNLKGRDFDRGRTLLAAANCFACHRFNNEGGGAGPELTGVAGRFSTRDLLESIVAPSKVISDQYAAVMIATEDGKVVTGRIVNLHNDTMSVNTNMLDPNLQTNVDRRKIEEMRPSPVSMMPEGLLNTLNRDEVLDLVAYLLSRGERTNAMFK